MSESKVSIKEKLLSLVNRYVFLTLFIPIIIISTALFSSTGIIFSQDFPVLDTSTYSEDRLWLWMEETSSSGFENLSRFTIIGIWYLLSFVFLNSEVASKFMIIVGFILSSFSFYGAFYYLLKEKFKENPFEFKIALILGSIFFAYNIWSINRVAHYYLWIGYAILPIFIVAVLRSYEKAFRIKYALMAAVSWTFAASTPHMMIYYGIIFLIISLGYLAYSFKSKSILRTVFRRIYSIALIGIFFIVLNLFWLVPYFLTFYYSSSLAGPTYLLNVEIIDIVSRTNDIVNTLRLSSDWINFEQNVAPKDNPILYGIWSVLGYVFVSIFVVAFILWHRKVKYSIFFFVLGVAGIILALGTYFPFNYWGLLFNLPIISSYLWIFRDPDKWSFLISISYSFMLVLFAISIFRLFQKNKKKYYIVSISFSILVIVMIVIHSYPVFTHSIYQKFSSLTIPADFQALNNYLEGIKPSKVFFLPYSSTTPTWSSNHTIGALYQFSADVPSIEISSPIQKKYYDYFSHLLYNNQTKTVGNFIYPFGSSYIIFHNDTISTDDQKDLLKYLRNVEDLNLVDSIGFFEVFRTDNEQNPVSITRENIGIVGGLDTFEILNKISSFNTMNSSVLFLDQFPKEDLSILNDFDLLLTPRTSINLLLSFVPDQYLLSLIGDTIHNDPSEYWSRVSTSDPLHGEFRPYIENLDIENWDFDYEKGVVITEMEGAKLKTQFNTNQTDIYEIYIRYLESVRGGIIKIYIDDEFVKEISTTSNLNKFQWLSLETRNLSKGTHTITLENVNGFNAVNTFTVLPNSVKSEIKTHLENGIKNLELAYFFDSGRDYEILDSNSTRIDLFNLNNLIDDNNKNNGSSLLLSGKVSIPQEITKIRFEFMTNSTNGEQINPVQRIIMNSTQRINQFNEDFENISNDFTLSKSANYSASLYKSDIINNNTSLKISVEKEPIINRDDPWQIVSTNFIPIYDSIQYKYKFDFLSENVVQFHPKIYYYDSNYDLIKEIILSDGINGNQEKQYSLNIFPPQNATYVKFAYFFLPNDISRSSFILDNISLIENLSPIIIDVEESADLALDSSNKLSKLRNNDQNSNSSTIISDSFSVLGNRTYSYYINLNENGLNAMNASLLLYSDNVIQSLGEGSAEQQTDLTNFGPFQSNFAVNTNFDIIRNGTYTILIRTNENPANFSGALVDGTKRNIEMNSNQATGQSDLYIRNVNLSLGTHELDLYFDYPPSIEFISIFSNDENNVEYNQDILTSLEDKFTSFGNKQQPPAKIENFSKISPTKYSIDISNATRPFNLILSESFDPLWVAKIEDDSSTYQFESKPFYSIVNGFHVNKTGNFELTIEYPPQKWFELGTTVSLVILPILLAITLYISKRFSK